MFEQTFKNIDDILHKDAGCGSELDYVEQTSWVLFLKYLDDLENDKFDNKFNKKFEYYMKELKYLLNKSDKEMQTMNDLEKELQILQNKK